MVELKIPIVFKFRNLILAIVTIYFLIGSVTFVSGIKYHFTESFDDPELKDWVGITANFTNTGLNGSWNQITNNYFVENGRLVSGGEYNRNQVFVIYRPDTTKYGVWSIDVKVPSNATNGVLGFTWGLFVSEKRVQHNSSDTGGGPSTLHFKFEESGRLSYTSDSAFILDKVKYGEWQHFDFIRTPDSFYAYVDR